MNLLEVSYTEFRRLPQPGCALYLPRSTSVGTWPVQFAYRCDPALATRQGECRWQSRQTARPTSSASSMIAMPDASTFELLPWRPEDENAVARMFCDIKVPGGDAYEGDPRWILRRALERAGDLGFDTYNVGP